MHNGHKMGSVSLNIGDGTARFKRPAPCSSATNILMLLSVITTNLFAFYAFTSSPQTPHQNPVLSHNLSLISHQVSDILTQIEFYQNQLTHLQNHSLPHQSLDLSFTSNSSSSEELNLFLRRHKLPLGKDSKTGLTEMIASVGHACKKSADLLSQYMSYRVYRPCPDDWSLAQKLILQGCEPLPKRRCFAKRVHKGGLFNFPDSLWKPVSNKSVTWSGFGCHNFQCLKDKKLGRDCIGCFDLSNKIESQKFVRARSKNDFLIDEVWGMGGGGIRIGLDIGGGPGTFAARMAERNVTVITNTLNFNAPYSEFIAARGLFPLYLSLHHRFPFYDNVFDLIHSSMSLEIGDEPEKLEFLMFDVDRVLRPGGLVWLDSFECASDKRMKELTGLIETFGYRKLKWAVGSGKSQVLLSAVLQKPVRVRRVGANVP